MRHQAGASGRAKLLHVVGTSPFGGGARMVIALARAAASAGYEVEILANDRLFVDELTKRGICSLRRDMIARSIRPLQDAGDTLRLRRIIRSGGYDIVHTHTSKAGIIGRAAARSAGTPTIVHTVHGFSYHEQTHRVMKRAADLAERVASRWCDAVVPVAWYLSDAWVRSAIAPAKKVVTIPNGVPDHGSVRDARTRIRTEFAIASARPLWLCQGRLAVSKGVDILLQSLATPRVRRLRPALLVAGSGPLDGELRSLVRRLQIDDMVILTGHRSDIEDLVCAADMVVLPSFREGLSIAVLEAMSAGAAIVATAIPANREATGEDAARLVPPGDVEALADALVELTASPAVRDSLAAKARSRYEEQYREATMTSAYLDLYDDLRSSR